MKVWHFLAAASLAVLVGCSSEEPAEDAAGDVANTPNTAQANPGAPPAAQPQGNTGGGGNSGVQIHTGGAGGIAPVTGTESLQGGGGGGVHQAAKDSARKAADKAGGSSLDQLGDE